MSACALLVKTNIEGLKLRMGPSGLRCTAAAFLVPPSLYTLLVTASATQWQAKGNWSPGLSRRALWAPQMEPSQQRKHWHLPRYVENTRRACCLWHTCVTGQWHTLHTSLSPRCRAVQPGHLHASSAAAEAAAQQPAHPWGRQQPAALAQQLLHPAAATAAAQNT